MTDEITASSRVYTDVQGLKKLQYTTDHSAAKKEIAQQFEALMMQMVMKSMRQATKSISGGLFSNNQMDLYQDMFDNQLSLIMSNSNMGLAKIIEKNIDQLENKKATPVVSTNETISKQSFPSATIKPIEKHAPAVSRDQALASTATAKEAPKSTVETTSFNSSEDFINKLWSTAKTAAKYLGTSPEILLAQAALETNWGKKIISNHEGMSTHNLFNIKSDAAWKKSTEISTLEHKEGVLVKERSKFKMYESFKESFRDYVNFIKNNARYSEALKKVSDPKQYVKALHDAGYATDPSYADKILDIYSSKSFQQLIDKVRNI